MMLGRVDDVDGHFVATRFVAFLVPTECVYVASPGARATRAETTIGNGMRIQTDWRSVALAYARVWLPALAIMSLVAQVALGRVALATWIITPILLGISVLSYRIGELPDKEKARLRALGTVTGLRIDPTKLLPATREVKRDLLAGLMTKAGIPLTPAELMSVIDDIPMPAMPLVYAYACYSGDAQEWRDCATVLYARYEQGDI
jgi:hypothetical protein